jgi:hypothetical protein
MDFPSPYIPFHFNMAIDEVVNTFQDLNVDGLNAKVSSTGSFESFHMAPGCTRCRCHPTHLRPSPLVCLGCLEVGQVPPLKCMVRDHAKTKMLRASP